MVPIYPLVPYPKVIINAAITGMVPTKVHSPHIPLSEDEIVRDAVACHGAGAAVVHLHVRDAEGLPDYRAESYGRIIRRVRAECDLVICVSTSARVFQAFEQRSEVLWLDGVEKPDLASLTMGSFNFPTQASVNPPDTIHRLAKTMMDRNIKPELEVFDTGMLNYITYLDRKLNLPKPLYCNLLLGALGGIPGRLSDLGHLLCNMPDEVVWSAAGIGDFQLPVNVCALVAGGGVRVGLEDMLYMDFTRQELATNGQLVARIARFARDLGREIATPGQARQILNLIADKP